ncbi:MAG: alpha-maltose-phosphate synthase [Thermoanaerobaculia bacterium]|jgi:glycosyltransferase involved in cell wall biosynthesis|nr:alpha-maltose-phosphate synthase [Thermoanaerobaculia bacterium]
MRILHILSQRAGRSGSGIFLRAMVREAARRGYAQHVVVAEPPGTTAAELPPLRDADVSPIIFPSDDAPFPLPGNSDVMPYPTTVFSRMTPAQIEQYLRASRRVMERARDAFQPDVVHAHHLWLMTSLARDVFADIPLIVTSHNAELRQMVKAPHLVPRVLSGVRRADKVCVLTPQSVVDTIEHFGIAPERIAITGAGFDDELFSPRTRPREMVLGELRERFGLTLPADEKLITFIGRTSVPKGIPFLLDAVTQLRNRINARRSAGVLAAEPPNPQPLLVTDAGASLPFGGGDAAEPAGETPALRTQTLESTLLRFRLVLLGATGSGEQGRMMEELVAAAGPLVIHTGAQPPEAVALLLQVSDVFVLPSLFEGLPLTMLEALAAGCPAVVSALPTIASWVPQAWRDRGFIELVPPLETTNADEPVASDVARFLNDLAAAIARRLASPLDDDARRDLASRLAPHSWPHVFDRYEEIYRDVTAAVPATR